MAFDPTQMDADAKIALEELETIKASMTPEQLEGMNKTLDWIARHKNKAGYKRILRPIVNVDRSVSI